MCWGTGCGRVKEKLFSLTKKDFIVQPFKGSGPGGQHRNKNATAIRIIHPDSGAVGESQKHKSQLQNKKEAFKNLVNTAEFKKWHRIKVAELLRDKEQQKKEWDRWMHPVNFKVETYDSNKGKFVEIS